ncbi:TolC family protein [Hydrogenispora ethanolica]|uniref:TolC family protein n=1 Tax=Hydrogenispora ethanolica TaxID=1082276 RepID=UPI001A9FB367|nr:TolC family protein [Hydrogenispora ethanolica]
MKKKLIAWAVLLITALGAGGMAVAAGTALNLEKSIELALKNNRAVKIAETEQEAAAGRLRELRAEKLPVINLTHSGSRLKPNPSEPAFQLLGVDPPVTDYFENKLTASLPLYTGGQLEGYIQQAELGVKNAGLNVTRIKQQVKLDATVAYYNLLQAKSLVKLSEETVERLAAHLKNVQARFNAELITKNDVLRSEVELADAEQSLIKARNGYDLALANLNYVMGIPLGTEIAVEENLSHGQWNQTLNASIEQALQKRPEVAQYDINYEVAKRGVAVAQGGYLPTVSLVGAVDRNDADFPGNDNGNWSVSLVASWDLYNSGRTKSRIDQAKASQDKARQASLQAREAIGLEVRQAYLNVNEAEQRIHASELALDKANEDYQLVRARYRAGLGTNLDVIDTQLALTLAKTNHINALYDYNISLAKLQKAMGM